ncbi:MAG: alkaline phosphatase family protein [Arenimonas sp.]
MKRSIFIAALLSALLPGLASAPAQARPAASKARLSETLSPDGLPRRLVLALDGIPYEVFAQVQREGRFAEFQPAARMVSTFPALSDVAFAQIEGSVPPAGYQTRHFDPAQNRVVGNNVGALSERAHPKIASDATSHSVPHRIFGYAAPMRIARSELHEIGRDLLLSRKDTFVAYLGTSDAVLHLHGRAGALKFLAEVDEYLQQLQAQVRARSGRELKIDLVSDHGSTMMGSRVVPVAELLAGCGFRRSAKMESERDVAFALPGIVGSMAITTRPAQVEEAARCLDKAEGMDLVAVNRTGAVGVLNRDGEAEVRLLPGASERYGYRVLHGDPLGLLALSTGADAERVFDEPALFAATVDGARPDPLRRLWRAFHGEVGEPSSLLLSLQDGYEVGNPALRFATRLRGGHAGTHGSMTRLSSLGMIASNWRPVVDVNTGGAFTSLFGEGAAAALEQAPVGAVSR